MVAVGCTLVSLIVFWFVGLSVSKPISVMAANMRELANGNLDQKIAYDDRKDEIGEMASALKVFLHNAIERMRLEAETKKTQEAQEEHQKTIESLILTFDGEVQELLEVVDRDAEGMQRVAQNMTGLSETTTVQTTSAAAASEQASMSVQTVASATEELTASIGEINSQIGHAQKVITTTTEANRNDKRKGFKP